MSYAQAYYLEQGDRIIAKLPFFYKHFAIYIGFVNGKEYLAQNTVHRGAHLILAADFFAEHGECTVEKFAGSTFQRQQVFQRAIQPIYRPYNLISFNCEHFANYVQYGTSSSPQVLASLFLGAVGMALYNR